MLNEISFNCVWVKITNNIYNTNVIDIYVLRIL